MRTVIYQFKFLFIKNFKLFQTKAWQKYPFTFKCNKNSMIHTLESDREKRSDLSYNKTNTSRRFTNRRTCATDD